MIKYFLTLTQDVASCLLQVFASEHGYEYVGEVRGFPGHFIFRKIDHDGEAEARHLTMSLLDDLRVLWAEQQFGKIRVKRDINPKVDDRVEYFKRLVANDMIKSIPEELLELWNEEEAYDHPEGPRRKDEMFNDELWDHQWYLHDTRYLTDNLPDISLHVESIWKKGIAGNGVRVVVIDDGLEWSHPDLVDNYDADISYDFNDDDPDVSPRDETNSHGTR